MKNTAKTTRKPGSGALHSAPPLEINEKSPKPNRQMHKLAECAGNRALKIV
jgi:hypothetical protein